MGGLKDRRGETSNRYSWLLNFSLVGFGLTSGPEPHVTQSPFSHCPSGSDEPSYGLGVVHAEQP